MANLADEYGEPTKCGSRGDGMGGEGQRAVRPPRVEFHGTRDGAVTLSVIRKTRA
jgi:hypothetical protein